MFDTSNKLFKIIDFGEAYWRSLINKETKSLFLKKN